MTFLRLSRGHVIAAVAALVLLLVMAVDWYSTDMGESFRRDESILGEDPAPPGTEELLFEQELQGDASIQAEEEERNAWTADDALDRVVLGLLLASIVLALVAALLRAADRRYPPPYTPSVAAAALAAVAALLVVVRIIDVGAVEAGGQVEVGAPLGLLAVGALAIGSSLAARDEREAAERPERDPGAERSATA